MPRRLHYMMLKRPTLATALAARGRLALGFALQGQRGNKVSTAGMALSQWLKSMRDSVLVDWKPQLRDAKSMCTVGTVYLNSPAQTAGLRSGDSLVAFGPVQHADFQSVAETVVPIVKANVGKPIRRRGGEARRGGAGAPGPGGPHAHAQVVERRRSARVHPQVSTRREVGGAGISTVYGTRAVEAVVQTI